MEHTGRVNECCIAPPALSEIALLEAIDGEGSPETLAHLEGCAACARRAEELRRLQLQLQTRLYRMFCPATEVLIDFHLGLLPSEQHELVRQHLALCPHCAPELETLRSVRLGPYGPAPPPYWQVVRFHS